MTTTSLNSAAHACAERYLRALAAAAIDKRVRVEFAERVLWLRIDRAGQHNALALTMLDALATALQLAASELAAAPDTDWLRLAVITGTGTESFAAGGDLKELDQVRSESQTRAMTLRGMAALNAVRDFPQPVLAGLNGSARGGGAELATACDLRIAHPEASIGFIQANLNLSSAWGGGTDLMQRLGPARALRVLAEAELMAAEEARAEIDSRQTDT